MVLRVGRCTELIGSRFLRIMAGVFTLPHGGVLGLRGRQLYCEQGKGGGEAEVVEEACCIAYPVCNATAPPGQHENSTEVDTAGAQRQGQPHTSTHITSWSAAGPQHGHSEAPAAHPGRVPGAQQGLLGTSYRTLRASVEVLQTGIFAATALTVANIAVIADPFNFLNPLDHLVAVHGICTQA